MSTSRLLGLDPEQVLTAPIDLHARAHDASHFLLYPQVIAVPRNADDVARLLRSCAASGTCVTFRSGGTSLSGQASTDAVLADVRHHFDGIEILDNGLRVRVEPGVTVNRVNAHLAPYGRQIGPDPASSAACTIGGVVANNSSGMACGTTENSYRTLESMVVVLASGTVIDTGASDADEKLRMMEPALYRGLVELRERILSNSTSVAVITQQFSMKNTMGYGLNSFLDYSTPAQILAHLMVGSEGTLGFIASAILRTISVRPYVETGLLVFRDLHAANQALPDLVATGAATLELMDATSIAVGQGLAGCPDQIRGIQPISQAALLVEYQAETPEELDGLVKGAREVLSGLDLEQPGELSRDPKTRSQLWVLRKGLYTAVASARRVGTTALLEDVVVPVEALADTCTELGELFEEYSYPDSVIFGHAKDGNIHFMITDEFDKQLERYERFTQAMVDVVLSHQGSLKAEHGTGRVMAPFVRQQYGDELFDVMCKVKQLFDPWDVLNDGSVITHDPRAHVRHIKTAVPVDPYVDACVECGYCEPICPAHHLTLTPRQRIAVQREIAGARQRGENHLASCLESDYQYAGLQTCAVDGMCGTACPVGINTGFFVKKARAKVAPRLAQGVWGLAAQRWAGTTHIASFALSAADDLGFAAPVITKLNQLGRAVLGKDQLPLWSPDLPQGGRSRQRPEPTREPAAIYIPACVNSMFGPSSTLCTQDSQSSCAHHSEVAGSRHTMSCTSAMKCTPINPQGVQAAFESLCACAGITLLVPRNIDALCCGTPWSSKGMTQGYETMAARVIPTLKTATDNGRIPIVCDASSCTEGLMRMLAEEPALQVIDCVEFVAERILPLLPPAQKVDSITLHPTCSSTQLGLNPHMVTLAEAAATTVNLPVDAGCCAFAGDRGMLHPELTYAATRPEAYEVAALNAEVHASCNRTCEIGMTRATGEPYHHILEILASVMKTLSPTQGQ